MYHMYKREIEAHFLVGRQVKQACKARSSLLYIYIYTYILCFITLFLGTSYKFAYVTILEEVGERGLLGATSSCRILWIDKCLRYLAAQSARKRTFYNYGHMRERCNQKERKKERKKSCRYSVFDFFLGLVFIGIDLTTLPRRPSCLGIFHLALLHVGSSLYLLQSKNK